MIIKVITVIVITEPEQRNTSEHRQQYKNEDRGLRFRFRDLLEAFAVLFVEDEPESQERPEQEEYSRNRKMSEKGLLIQNTVGGNLDSINADLSGGGDVINLDPDFSGFAFYI